EKELWMLYQDKVLQRKDNMFSFYFKKYVWTNLIKYSKLIMVLAAFSVFLIFIGLVIFGLIYLPIGYLE
ncbi:hypothetical protein C4M98_01105, partial [Mycoplasmopsis pullorum]